MKIKFLGTSYGAPCKDRHQQSILIEENEDLYIFDAGAPVLEILIKDGYDLTKVKAVFVSHIHGDHLNGILDMLNLADHFKMRFTVYVSEQRAADFLKGYCELQGCALASGSVQFRLIEEGAFYTDRLLSVCAFKTKHIKNGEIASFGFLVESNRGKLCLTGDLSSSLNDFPEFLYREQIDLVITECAHFSPESLFEKLLRCRADSFAIIHVMPSNQYAQLKTVAENSPLKVYFPNDNDEIELKN